jgi:hypothetical protein
VSPDLTHVDTWIFDLDNTVYPMDAGLMAEIDARMTGFVARVAGLPRDEAFALQAMERTDLGEEPRVRLGAFTLDADVVRGHLLAHLAQDREHVHRRAAAERGEDQFRRAGSAVTAAGCISAAVEIELVAAEGLRAEVHALDESNVRGVGRVHAVRPVSSSFRARGQNFQATAP